MRFSRSTASRVIKVTGHAIISMHWNESALPLFIASASSQCETPAGIPSGLDIPQQFLFHRKANYSHVPDAGNHAYVRGCGESRPARPQSEAGRSYSAADLGDP